MIRPHRPPKPATVVHHYDALDEIYRELWGEHLHHGLWLHSSQSVDEVVRQLVALVATEARIRPGRRVCDAGSGYGATARLLARAGAKVTAVTLSPRQHAYACGVADNAGNPTYLLGDWLTCPLEEQGYDAVIAIESTEHMLSQAAFFKKVRGILKPGGRLVVCAWLAQENATRLAQRLLLGPICREGRLSCLPTASGYGRWIEDAGLALVRFQDLSLYVRRTWPTCIARLGRALATDRRYVRYLFAADDTGRSFVRAMFRICAAYYLGMMRYGIFTVTHSD